RRGAGHVEIDVGSGSPLTVAAHGLSALRLSYRGRSETTDIYGLGVVRAALGLLGAKEGRPVSRVHTPWGPSAEQRGFAEAQTLSKAVAALAAALKARGFDPDVCWSADEDFALVGPRYRGGRLTGPRFEAVGVRALGGDAFRLTVGSHSADTTAGRLLTDAF